MQSGKGFSAATTGSCIFWQLQDGVVDLRELRARQLDPSAVA